MSSEPTDWPATLIRPIASQWIDAVGQVLRLPFVFALSGVETLGRTLRVLQDATTLAAGAARPVQTYPVAPPAPPIPSGALTSPSATTQPDNFSQSVIPGSANSGDSNPNPGVPSSAAPNKPKETVMADTNLSDDMVKLVSYSIVSIKRGDEKELVCNQCKVFSDNMTGEDFVSWVIAEYVETHKDTNTKYLRVGYDVQGRWVKQPLYYEEKQLDALGGIEQAILTTKK